MLLYIYNAESTDSTVSEDITVLSKQAIASVTAKAPAGVNTLEEQSLVATPITENTSPSEATRIVSVVLTQAGPQTSDHLEINQLIDNLVDNGWLSYINIAGLCLSSLQEKNEMLKPLLDGVKMFQGSYVHIYVIIVFSYKSL